MPLLSVLILCTSAQGPVVDPVDPSCTGCVANVTFDLPSWAEVYEPFDGGCWDLTFDWTITRDLEIHGQCGFVEEGSCVEAQRCLASGRAVGTATSPYGTETLSLAAGTNDCGGADSDEDGHSDGSSCIGWEASIEVSCTACTGN